MPLDLGGILSSAVNTFIGAKYGAGAPPQVNVGTGVISAADLAGGPGLGVTPALGLPFVDVIPEAEGGKNMVWNPRANCGAGKWIRRSRRRRKRLASASDIKDLSALKSVLGPSNLKTWIATHS